MDINTVTAIQCREARMMLRWNARDLSHKSNVDAKRIIRFEEGKDKLLFSELRMLYDTFVKMGIEFLSSGAVRHGPPYDASAERDKLYSQYERCQQAMGMMMGTEAETTPRL